MKKVILTFLLTSLFWWVLFTYSAYKRSVQNSDIEDDPIEQVVAETEATPIEPVRSNPPKNNSATKTEQTKTSIKQDVASSSPVTKPSNEVKQKPLEKILATTTDIPNSTPKQEKQQQEQPQTLNYKEEIVGKWQPIEGAENPLEFTKYGTVIQTIYDDIEMRYNYQINEEKLKIKYDNATFKIIKEGGNTFLEIYNSNDFSGRYRRKSQPSNINSSIINKSEYVTYIVGKWTPITGQENPIEFTKFNTAIQTIYSDIDMRHDYSLNNDRLSIKYDKNARVVISEDANYYYLEIYNTTDFSGRYKKSK